MATRHRAAGKAAAETAAHREHMTEYEKLGTFYLGRTFDIDHGKNKLRFGWCPITRIRLSR
jgi:uncharacterized protein YciI